MGRVDDAGKHRTADNRAGLFDTASAPASFELPQATRLFVSLADPDLASVHQEFCQRFRDISCEEVIATHLAREDAALRKDLFTLSELRSLLTELSWPSHTARRRPNLDELLESQPSAEACLALGKKLQSALYGENKLAALLDDDRIGYLKWNEGVGTPQPATEHGYQLETFVDLLQQVSSLNEEELSSYMCRLALASLQPSALAKLKNFSAPDTIGSLLGNHGYDVALMRANLEDYAAHIELAEWVERLGAIDGSTEAKQESIAAYLRAMGFEEETAWHLASSTLEVGHYEAPVFYLWKQSRRVKAEEEVRIAPQAGLNIRDAARVASLLALALVATLSAGHSDSSRSRQDAENSLPLSLVDVAEENIDDTMEFPLEPGYTPDAAGNFGPGASMPLFKIDKKPPSPYLIESLYGDIAENQMRPLPRELMPELPEFSYPVYRIDFNKSHPAAERLIERVLKQGEFFAPFGLSQWDAGRMRRGDPEKSRADALEIKLLGNTIPCTTHEFSLRLSSYLSQPVKEQMRVPADIEQEFQRILSDYPEGSWGRIAAIRDLVRKSYVWDSGSELQAAQDAALGKNFMEKAASVGRMDCDQANAIQLVLLRRAGIPSVFATGFHFRGRTVTLEDGHGFVIAYVANQAHWQIADATPSKDFLGRVLDLLKSVKPDRVLEQLGDPVEHDTLMAIALVLGAIGMFTANSLYGRRRHKVYRDKECDARSTVADKIREDIRDLSKRGVDLKDEFGDLRHWYPHEFDENHLGDLYLISPLLGEAAARHKLERVLTEVDDLMDQWVQFVEATSFASTPPDELVELAYSRVSWQWHPRSGSFRSLPPSPLASDLEREQERQKDALVEKTTRRVLSALLAIPMSAPSFRDRITFEESRLALAEAPRGLRYWASKEMKQFRSEQAQAKAAYKLIERIFDEDREIYSLYAVAMRILTLKNWSGMRQLRSVTEVEQLSLSELGEREKAARREFRRDSARYSAECSELYAHIQREEAHQRRFRG